MMTHFDPTPLPRTIDKSAKRNAASTISGRACSGRSLKDARRRQPTIC
jgi:hypothetical protein